MSAKRQTRWARLIPTLLVTPIFSGALGGLVLMLWMMAASLIAGDALGTDGSPAGLIFASLVALFVSVMGGVIYSVLIGTPFIVVFWLGAHLFTRRRAAELAAAIAIAGALFAQYAFSNGLWLHNAGGGGSPESWRTAFGWLPALAGAISGGIAGYVISALGYRNPRTETAPETSS